MLGSKDIYWVGNTTVSLSDKTGYSRVFCVVFVWSTGKIMFFVRLEIRQGFSADDFVLFFAFFRNARMTSLTARRDASVASRGGTSLA